MMDQINERIIKYFRDGGGRITAAELAALFGGTRQHAAAVARWCVREGHADRYEGHTVEFSGR
jgi:hypothetical protein